WATGLGATSVGTLAEATGVQSTALGTLTYANGDGSTALGSGSIARSTDSTAIGFLADAAAANSVALGVDSVADRENTVSVGSAGNERQIANVADGTEATDAVNLAQLEAVTGDTQYFAATGEGEAYALGQDSTASGSDAFAE